MFDELIKELKKLERTSITFTVEMDEDGYYDKECPNEDCLFQFKVHAEDWKNICNDDSIHCPLCGHKAPSSSWWTQEQIDSGKKQSLNVVSASINKGLVAGARKFNSTPQRGLVQVSMKVSGNGPTFYSVMPIRAHEEMRLKISCEECSTRFAVIGSAYFCPSCGHNSVNRIFENSLKKVEVKLNNLETVRIALIEAVDKDTAEITCRSMIETGINDCVVAFQKIMESLYLKLPNAQKPPFNAFQRIEDGSSLWKKTCNKGYEDWISPKEFSELNILFNKRHLLAHTEGFVDHRYLDKSGDSSYSVGQRIVIKEGDVRKFVSIIKKIVSKARQISTNNTFD